MDEATLLQLLNSANGSGGNTASLFDVDAIMKSLAPFMIALTVVSAVITILYIISVIGKWRANKAMLDIRKLLVEMNERDKARSAATVLRDVADTSAKPADQPLTTPQI